MECLPACIVPTKLCFHFIVCGLIWISSHRRAWPCYVLQKHLALFFWELHAIIFIILPKKQVIGKLIPMYAVVILIIAIGLFPKVFITALSKAVALFIHNTGNRNFNQEYTCRGEALSMIGLCAAGFLLLAGLIYFIRKKMTINKPAEFEYYLGMRIHWSNGKNAIHGQFIYPGIPETGRTSSFHTKKEKGNKGSVSKRVDRKRILMIKLNNG